jgi:lysophospholipase L1-like esterase
MGAVMPGSRPDHITRSARREINQLHRDDFVIIFGGANDINVGLRHIRKFAFQNKHINVITMTAPYSYNLQDSSCISEEIHIIQLTGSCIKC